MVAPGVASANVMRCADLYVPAAGKNTGVLTVEGTTVMLMCRSSLTFVPQHFTCRMCAPDVALTAALNEVAVMVVAPESME